MRNSPLTENCISGRIGILIGCGASLDLCPITVLNAIKSNDVFSVGVGNVAASYRFKKAQFSPDVLFQFDGMPSDDIFADRYADICDIYEEQKGKSWRVCVEWSQYPVYPWADQSIPIGDISRYGTGSGTAAWLMHYWGCKHIHCIGIDNHGPYCKWWHDFREAPDDECWQNSETHRVLALGGWERLQKEHQDLKITWQSPGKPDEESTPFVATPVGGGL